MIIAYEPIWAIGTGKTATAGDAQTVCHTMPQRGRCAIRGRRGDGGPHPVRRVGQGRHDRKLMAQPDVDGALVSDASLDPDEFSRIVQFAAG